MDRPTFNSHILLPGMQISGRAEPVGPWIAFLNGRDKINMSIYDARLTMLTPGASSVERPQVIINRNLAHLIVLTDAGARDAVQMVKNTAMAILHVGPVICRGEIHLSTDTPLGVYFDDLQGDFFPVTNAALHTLSPLPMPLPRQSDLVLINRQAVLAYYPG